MVGLAVICLNVSVSFLAVGILGRKQEGGKSMESAEEKKKKLGYMFTLRDISGAR